MGLVLWPAAIAGFIVWSIGSWLLYVATDWFAALAAGMATSVLAAELRPWVATAFDVAGDLAQAGVAVAWAIVGIGILASPIWLRPWRAYRWSPAAGRGDRGHRFDAEMGRLRSLADDLIERHRRRRSQWRRH